MSYCRFSSSNWRSDVYVYEHCNGGFMTHVAGRKRVIPAIPEISLSWIPRFGGELSIEERRTIYPSRWHSAAAMFFIRIYMVSHRLTMLSLKVIPLKDIGLPHDGEAFSDDTASECADRLGSLRALGYHVPQYAIDALREEAASLEANP